MKFSVNIDLPESVKRDVDVRRSFQRVMLESVHSVVDPMVDSIKAQTPYPSIQQAYSTQDAVTGDAVYVRVTNSSDVWPFREYNTRPHWPPYGPGTSLAQWSEARGIKPFLVARAISRRGTQGNYIVTKAWEQTQPRIQQAVQSGLYAWALGLGAV